MRKSGKKIRQSIAVVPLGMKRGKYELDARIALVALQNRVHNEQHLVDLWTLADLCERLEPDEKHILTHAESVKRLVQAIHGEQDCGLACTSITASANLLLNWINGQNNSKICRIALEKIKGLAVNERNSGAAEGSPAGA